MRYKSARRAGMATGFTQLLYIKKILKRPCGKRSRVLMIILKISCETHVITIVSSFYCIKSKLLPTTAKFKTVSMDMTQDLT